ncbi:hypothetical protein [Maricaulis sp.]|uniref:hypothetical protein n=1 Tax=Maricaulis sp. TaxID=1486257 RepID=UPI0025C14350|nr:hypothetical protein [Maricaulis sp.]
MVTKSALIAGLFGSALGLPVALPYAVGASVSVSIGPVAVEISRSHGVDFDLDVSCLVTSCPIAMVQFRSTDAPDYQPVV